LIEQVGVNRSLAQMISDLDLEVWPGDLAFRPVESATIAEVFDELEFGGNLRERVVDAFPNIEGSMPEPENDVKVSVTDKSVSEWLKDKIGRASCRERG